MYQVFSLTKLFEAVPSSSDGTLQIALIDASKIAHEPNAETLFLHQLDRYWNQTVLAWRRETYDHWI